MCGCGGSQAQNEAKNDPLASDSTQVNQVASSCAKPKTILRVKVVRSDTFEGVEGIRVKAKGGSAPGDQTSAAQTGLADFGEVTPATYTIGVELEEEQRKQFRARDPVPKVVGEGVTLTTMVAVDPLVALRIILFEWDSKDKKDKPRKDLAWKLTKPLAAGGTTGEDGLIQVLVLFKDKKGELEVTWRSAEKGQDLVAEAGAATDYPIKIKYDDWKDQDQEDVLPKEDDRKIKWTFDIADLAKGDNEDGIKARLHNMGFPVGDIDATKHAVRAYQALYLDLADGSGSISDVTDDVKNRHDKP